MGHWSVRMWAGWAVVVTVALVGVAIWAGVAGVVWLAAVFIAVAALVAVFITIRVVVDESGLTVEYGPASWPRSHVELARIASVEVVEVRPLRWGGWGYRGGLWIFGAAAVVVRGGEAIQVTRHDGKRFVVTVDDATAGAAALERLLPPRASGSSVGG